MRKRIIFPEDLLAIANSVQATGVPKMKCASAPGLGNPKSSQCQPKEAAGAGIELRTDCRKFLGDMRSLATFLRYGLRQVDVMAL